MIRRALASDTTRVVELLADSRRGAGFDDAAGVSGFVFPFDPTYAERLFLVHVTNGNCCAFVHDVAGVAQGILMGVVFDHPYGPVRVSKDSMWWIDPAHRGGMVAVRMLELFEAWAREHGAKFGGIAGMGHDPAISRLLERRGYRAAEVHFLKAI